MPASPPHPEPVPESAAPAQISLGPIKAAYFVYYIAFGLFIAYINVYFHNIGMTGVQIGWISALIPLVGVLSGPVWGLLSDKIGRARVLLGIAGIGSMIAALGLSSSNIFSVLLPLAGLHSLFSTNIPPMIDAVNLKLLGAARERYGRQRIWGSMGYIVSTFGFGLLLKQLGLHWLFTGYAIVMFTFVLVMRWMPARRVPSEGAPWKDLPRLITQPQWLFLSASLLLLGVASSGMNNFLGVYLKALGASESLIGGAASLGALAEIPVMLFSAALIARFGLKRLLAFAFLIYALRFGIYAVIPSPIWALPVALLHGVTFGLFWVSSVVYVNHMAPDNLKATSQTLLVAVLSLANVIGAPLSGLIFDRLGPGTLFGMYALFSLAGLLVLLTGYWFNKNGVPAVVAKGVE